jgi:hypothetical protein
LDTRRELTNGAEYRSGIVIAVAENGTQWSAQDWKTGSANRADVFVAKWEKQRLKLHGLRT